MMREEVRPGRREGVVGLTATQSACTGRARLKAVGGQGTRGAHVEHAEHGRDAGGVPIGDVRVEVRQVSRKSWLMSVILS